MPIIPPLQQFCNLSKLCLVGHQISVIRNLEFLKNLEELWLCECSIKVGILYILPGNSWFNYFLISSLDGRTENIEKVYGGVSLREKQACKELRTRLGIQAITEVMQKRRLRWFGHVERRDDTNWLKRNQKLDVDGRNGCGRPSKTWEQVIKEDLCEKGLRSEAAQNRAEWRSVIT